MPNLLSSSTKNGSPYSLIRTLSIVFLVFMIIGLVLGFLFARAQIPPKPQPASQTSTVSSKTVSYEGRVSYIEPFMYPQDNITYVLTDNVGNEVILLRSNDQKLEVSEGHYVEVVGEKKKLSDGKTEYLQVNKLTIKNATN